MLWMMFQALVAFAVFSANIYFGLTTNGYIAGGWAFMAAYALTVFPFQASDWWKFRHARRAENAMKKAAGIPYGWRRHLPRKRRSVLNDQVLPNGSRGTFSRQSRTDSRP
jgi:hypothetical protein